MNGSAAPETERVIHSDEMAARHDTDLAGLVDLIFAGVVPEPRHIGTDFGWLLDDCKCEQRGAQAN